MTEGNEKEDFYKKQKTTFHPLRLSDWNSLLCAHLRVKKYFLKRNYIIHNFDEQQRKYELVNFLKKFFFCCILREFPNLSSQLVFLSETSQHTDKNKIDNFLLHP